MTTSDFDGDGTVGFPDFFLFAGLLPDTPPGVWWTIAIFSALTVGAMAGWLCFILRAFRAAFHQKTRFQKTERQAIGVS